MSYLNFDKKNLTNLEYSLNHEILRSNRAGSYASTTIVGCNTRKYHGLLVCPIEHLDGDKHVLLSSLDVAVVNNKEEFNFGIHKYQGDLYYPRGHKYVQDFKTNSIPQIYYRIGSLRYVREIILVEGEQQILIKYTILEAESIVNLKFTPFLAFRNMHQLSKANLHVNTKVTHIENGISTRLYDGYPNLHLQFSKEVEFVQVPDWNYNIEYQEEQRRGYEYKEDLFIPGFFETSAQKGESIFFSASTTLDKANALKKKFTLECNKRIPRNSFKGCLMNSAQQFIVKNGKKTEVIAGYHWFGSWGRDTFIALPGLTLTMGDKKTFLAVVDTMVKKLKKGLFPNMGSEGSFAYNTVDASMWFFWALQQYAYENENYNTIWNNYNKPLKEILSAYKEGTLHNIQMLKNGLIYAGENGKALTWMDAIVNGKPITPRIGCNVEINALWYNAICFALELAEKSKDSAFIIKWKKWPKIIKESFEDIFWDEEKNYLADTVDGNNKDWSIRPNQIIAVSVRFSPILNDKKNAVLETVRKNLLTPRGLRTLAPKNPMYKGIYGGNQEQRDISYHQGTVWPWLIEHYVTAYLNLHKKSGLQHVKSIIEEFEPVMYEHGIGSVSEIYDGDPPHLPKGAITQAWSVAALLRIIDKTEKLEIADQ